MTKISGHGYGSGPGRFGQWIVSWFETSVRTWVRPWVRSLSGSRVGHMVWFMGTGHVRFMGRLKSRFMDLFMGWALIRAGHGLGPSSSHGSNSGSSHWLGHVSRHGSDNGSRHGLGHGSRHVSFMDWVMDLSMGCSWIESWAIVRLMVWFFVQGMGWWVGRLMGS